MMGYIDCPKCGREIDEICADYDWSLEGREPTFNELYEYYMDAKKWVEKERVCKPGDFEPPIWKASRKPGCGHVWTSSFKGALIQNDKHTRIYLSHAPGYFEELLKQDGPLSNWMREEIKKDE